MKKFKIRKALWPFGVDILNFMAQKKLRTKNFILKMLKNIRFLFKVTLSYVYTTDVVQIL